MSTSAGEPIDSAALLRFISGESPSAERATIQRWMAAAPANRAEVDRLARAWELSATRREPLWDLDGLWSGIEQEIQPLAERRGGAGTVRSRGAAVRRLVLVPPSIRSARLSTPVRIAIAAVLIVAAVLLSRDAFVLHENDAVEARRTYATKRGERAELRLADGSRVVLGGASTLRIPETFGESARELYLDGEAYFEVTHDSGHALRVHTARTVTEDIGTRFVITAYAGDEMERVAVAEGAVALRGSHTDESVVLEASDVGHVSASGTVSATRDADIDQYFSWVGDVLRFDEEKLSDAVRVIGRQYGVDVRITDTALARRRFTGSIRADRVYDDLRGLALVLDARYERRADAVILAPQGSSRQRAPR
jgi:transmembrane sensor